MGGSNGIGGTDNPVVGRTGTGGLGEGVHGAGHESGKGVGETVDNAGRGRVGPNDNGRTGQGNEGRESHTRLRETQAQAQQLRSRVEGRQTTLTDRLDNVTRGRVHGDSGGDQHGQLRLNSHVDGGRGHVETGGDNHLRGFERERRELSRLFDAHPSHAARGNSSDALRSDLSHAARHLLDAVSRHLDRESAASLRDDSNGKLLHTVERALEHAARAADRTSDHAGRAADRALDHAGRGVSDASRGVAESFGRAPEAPGRFVREAVEELLGAAQLGRHFRQVESTGGPVVRQAESAVARALYGPPEGDAPGGFVFTQTVQPRLHPQEILRDLRAGAFLPAGERTNPFPLTGRARVVAEMMELMRTLDAFEGALKSAGLQAGASAHADESVAVLLKAYLSGAADGTADELLALLFPTLPGRAARLDIPRTVAAMNGLLTDADGRALLARDGTPLKLDRLVWLGAAGGLLAGMFEADAPPSRLSPLLLYGFDAVYAVIGFDGRALSSQHFVAVQASVNDSEHETVFGQQPFTAGWVRELIERLKDSAVVEHNLFGETLEEAWVDGRFHVALLSVTVEEGRPAPAPSAVTRLLPGSSGELAFA